MILEAAGRLAAIPGVEAFELLAEVSPKNSYRFGISMESRIDSAYEQYNAHPASGSYRSAGPSEVTDFLEIDYTRGSVEWTAAPALGNVTRELGRFGGERLSRKPPSADDAEPDDRDRKEECGYGPEERRYRQYCFRGRTSRAEPWATLGQPDACDKPGDYRPSARPTMVLPGQCSGISPERPPTFWRLGRRGWFVDCVRLGGESLLYVGRKRVSGGDPYSAELFGATH